MVAARSVVPDGTRRLAPSFNVRIGFSNDSGLSSMGSDSDTLLADESRMVVNPDDVSNHKQGTLGCTSNCDKSVGENSSSFRRTSSDSGRCLRKPEKLNHVFDSNMAVVLRRRSYDNLAVQGQSLVLFPYLTLSESSCSLFKESRISKQFCCEVAGQNRQKLKTVPAILDFYGFVSGDKNKEYLRTILPNDEANFSSGDLKVLLQDLLFTSSCLFYFCLQIILVSFFFILLLGFDSL